MVGPDQPDRRSERERALVVVAREMARIYRDQFGRGPAVSRAYWAGDDALVALLDGTLTPAERTFARMGEHQRLRESRLYLQYAAEEELRRVVEAASGRTVRAFMSGIDAGEDVSAEIFTFVPEDPPVELD